jgi:inner membrane protein
MPTPIGHVLAGIAVAGLSRRSEGVVPSSQIAVLAFCAAAPDLDLILRLVDGANHHRGPSHSLGVALSVGVLALLLRRAGLRLPSGASVAAAWGSHVALDYLGRDTSPPAGVMALWPFSSDFLISPFAIFLDIPRSFSAAAILHNLGAVAIEMAILAPIAWLAWGRPWVRRN